MFWRRGRWNVAFLDAVQDASGLGRKERSKRVSALRPGPKFGLLFTPDRNGHLQRLCE